MATLQNGSIMNKKAIALTPVKEIGVKPLPIGKITRIHRPL
ncbi:MAG: hypothetical protein RMY64_27615 [Nostoc sp. DedQUE08]|nr:MULTISPECIES: hypothetical protein [unclassified Nostoc]MDZ8033593.1 hypothetical protein [Nostoc sp. DedSLP04]MDZ8069338.1 hypothetical protein [Nostoc sp. DedQUE08]MDZ8096063.1 hypothetical protein [Nostoc sp. DedQUE05]MDZ8130270.1 hypothetical protein [Nostoc sp. DedQUE07]MDZ8134261.1 hypothetical protein [Nostoc sp. DedQUE04]